VAPPIVLASASAVRLAVRRESGFAAEARPVDVDETELPGEGLEDCVTRLARCKLAAASVGPGEVVIACDTLGEHEGRLLGKPASADAAVALLTRLQGQVVRYVTACVMSYEGRLGLRTGEATVTLAPMSADEVTAHVATGEPLRAAGGINVRGIGAVFVESIDGDAGCAVGISPRHVWELLSELGVPLDARWSTP
jgi:septum formation protein